MKIPLAGFSGTAYRAHHPKWAFAPLSGDGAKRYGGRFNRPGSGALYLSLDPTTVWMEAQQAFPFKPQPLTLVAYQVDCQRIADLTKSTVRRAARCSAADLGCAWEDIATQGGIPPTWRLAERLQSDGINGIRVRSYAPGCSDENQNLSLWNWDTTGPCSIQAIDDLGRLPKTTASWKK